MWHQFFILFIVVKVFFAATAASPVAKDTVHGDGGVINLVNLGSVDGKAYFYDLANQTWSGARTYCQQLGLQMAEITTNNQVQFLISKYSASGFTGWYWLGARDSKLPRALSWDSSGVQMGYNLDGISWRHAPTDYKLCAIYGAYSTPRYEMNNCTGLINIRILCETLEVEPQNESTRE